MSMKKMGKNLVLLYMFSAVQQMACRILEKNNENFFADTEKFEASGKKSYHWRTGNWGICFSGKGPNSCGQGKKERPVWCADSENRMILDLLCDSRKKPEKTKNCFTACRHHKDKLKWEVGGWGSCLEAEGKPEENDGVQTALGTNETFPTALYGLMQRNVSCILVSHEDIKLKLIVDEENCLTIARKPDSVRLCNIPKPQDCVVTDFLSWLPCRGCFQNANQTRIRNILVAPKNGGKPCPELSESRYCTSESDCLGSSFNKIKKEFHLKMSAWSKCEIPDSFTSAEESLYRFGTQPNGNLAFPVLDVSVSAESSEKQTIFHARVGYQTRELVCKDASGGTTDLSMCGVKAKDLPPRLRSCIVPKNCIVSEWSPWLKVEEGCTEVSGVVRSEIQERRRQILQLPEGDGLPCPHLLENKKTSKKEALPPCKNKYKRIPSKWSDCMVTSGKEPVKVGCGGGIQLRTVSCISLSTGQPVEDIHCSLSDAAEELPTVQRCEVACPRDCAVGEWDKWGPCIRDTCFGNGTALQEGYRLRKRSILVQPSLRGLTCPPTKEVQPCSDAHCYHWSVGHWGMCILNESGKCGPGLRKRSVKCVDYNMARVNDSWCENQEKPPHQEQCLLPCPFDCVLSLWSEWSPCSHPCSGQKMIALRQRNRTIIAPSGPGGHKCPNPDELTEMQPCNTQGCHGYSWLVLPWQPCMSKEGNAEKRNEPSIRDIQETPEFPVSYMRNTSSDEEESRKGCGKGIRVREVWCVEDYDIRVADAKCYPLEKPRDTETCIMECPIDCQMSPWAEWSPCPDECVPDASNEVRDGEVAPTQARSRVILQSASNGGRPCQHLDEFRPCPLSAARCRHYKWQLTEWSECQLPTSLKCGQGFRTRGVWCSRNHRTAKVSPTFCVENDGPPPVLSEKCTVDCSRHCILSPWSPWSKCSLPCRGETVRTRHLIGRSTTRTTCLNSDLYPLKERKSCFCELFKSIPDDKWSDCILEHSLQKIMANGRATHNTCGSGTRYKRNICVNKAGQIVEPSFCGMKSSLIEEPCIVPCPVDCNQSSWSTWGECSALCGPGFQTRTREIIQEPRDGGRPCDANFEVKICNTPCENFKWVSSGFTRCMLKSPDEFKGCGPGNQYRTVRCLNYGEHEIISQVRNEYCDPTNRPEDVSACQVSCPGDCVVSPWSSWSECDESCNSSKQRQRTRTLLRSPLQEATVSRKCPTLIQVQTCETNTTCFTYKWKTTPYGSCLPLGGSPCGEGIQKRAIYCGRSDGRSVSDEYCNLKNKPQTIEKWCYLECPVDCEVSAWTKWNSSECTCGSRAGVEYRQRRITTPPSSRGRPCPTNLKQKRPCPVNPCYEWVRGSWSSCTLEGADCGHGISYRNISCLRGNVEVEVQECFTHSKFNLNSGLSDTELIKLDLHSQTVCYLPCHGDCEVSGWSKWSHCHRDCQDNPTGGYQTRSRAIIKKPAPDGESCPTPLWETRPCNSGLCLTFDWSVENGSICCRRSDGLLVVGGCDEKKKPCLRNCSSIRNSHCFAGSCKCLDGFLPYWDSNSNLRLVACIAAKEGISINQKLAHPDAMADGEDMLRSHLLYLPGDELNIWMFAMIGIGCLFVVFVAVSFYLMCHNSNSSSQENTTQVLNTSKP